MACRSGAAAVLFALVCCLLVGPAPARGPVELLPKPLAIIVDVEAVDREASAEPLLPKPLAIVIDPSTVLSSVQAQEVEVDPAARQAPQVFRCGGEDAAVSDEPLSLSTGAQPAEEGRREQERRDGDSDSDTDGDSDSDDEDEDGIMGWFRRLARLF